MRKKDYLLIAKGFKLASEGCKSHEELFGVKMSAYVVMAQLQDNDPKFQTDKFLTACGIKIK